MCYDVTKRVKLNEAVKNNQILNDFNSHRRHKQDKHSLSSSKSRGDQMMISFDSRSPPLHTNITVQSIDQQSK